MLLIFQVVYNKTLQCLGRCKYISYYKINNIQQHIYCILTINYFITLSPFFKLITHHHNSIYLTLHIHFLEVELFWGDGHSLVTIMHLSVLIDAEDPNQCYGNQLICGFWYCVSEAHKQSISDYGIPHTVKMVELLT